MQRLVLAVIVLAILATLVALAAAGLRASLQPDGLLRGNTGSPMQKLAFAALFVVIFGVSAGWLGGL